MYYVPGTIPSVGIRNEQNKPLSLPSWKLHFSWKEGWRRQTVNNIQVIQCTMLCVLKREKKTKTQDQGKRDLEWLNKG